MHLAGEPPTVQLTIAGAHPAVRMTPVDNGVVLRAELAMSGPQEVGRLTDAALAMPGDTSFAFEANRLVATRTLAGPAPPQPGFRFYVETPAWMQASSGERVKELVPGAWYQAVDEEQGWVRAVTDEGVEGWVPVAAIRRT